MRRAQKTSGPERVANTIVGFRHWLFNSWRIAVLLGKGAYLLAERRRLFLKLGEETYSRILKGELNSKEFEPLIVQLDRITKKVHIEELLIHRIRFGKHPDQSEPPSPLENEREEQAHVPAVTPD